MKELPFNSPKHHIGFNLTVRRGVEWSLEDYVEIAGLGEKEIWSIVMRFKDLTDEDLELEHDLNCRTYAGLLKKMACYYLDFDEREIVTLVTYHCREEELE
jgi:hypothetical protein